MLIELLAWLFQLLLPYLSLIVALLLGLWSGWRLVIGWIWHRAVRQRKGRFTVGFFHPFCNSGGGGERVLWQYIRSLQLSDPTQRILVYTGDLEPGTEILRRAQERFNIPPVEGARAVEFVRLKWRGLVLASRWPRFTMLGQSIGSVILALEALWTAHCSVFVDTTGFAFSYPLARGLFRCAVHAYVHYPTISSDMLSLVSERRACYNNSVGVATSAWKAKAKLHYYRLFARLYARAGRSAHLVFVNSSWTRAHIEEIWNIPERVHTVFPPCDTASLQRLPLGRVATLEELKSGDAKSSSSEGGAKKKLDKSIGEDVLREDLIVSVSQFRPEKDHSLQLRSFALFLHQLRALQRSDPSLPRSVPRLVLLGGVRDEGDEKRVDELRRLAAQLDVADHVSFEINVTFDTLKSYLGRATAGLHTMWNEHFGIGVVELMAAGVVTIAHNSGGPKSDILVPGWLGAKLGYLAASEEEYAAAMMEVFASEARGSEAQQKMREYARQKAATYSDEAFEQKMQTLLMPFIRRCKQREGGRQPPAFLTK